MRREVGVQGADEDDGANQSPGRRDYMITRSCESFMPALLPVLVDWLEAEAWHFPRLCCVFGGG